MTKKTKTRLVMGLFILFLVLCIMVMVFVIYKDDVKENFKADIKVEGIEVLINEYPVWVVTISGDSTFQTVQIIKCWESFPNGQRKLRGYMVAVDSAGCRIYEEEPEYFLFQATIRAMRLQTELGKRKGD